METTKRILDKKFIEYQLNNKQLLSEDSAFMESHQEEAEEYQEDYQDYLDGSGEVSQRYAWAMLFRMSEWYIKLGQMLAADNNQHEMVNMAQAAHYGYWWLKLGPEITSLYKKRNKSDSEVQLRDASRVISYLLLTNHSELAAEIGLLCADEINKPFFYGGVDWWIHPWFLLQLVCRWQHITLDLTQCDVPTDMGIYSQVLANWNTQDIKEVQQLVSQMADFHMATAKPNMSDDELNDFDEHIFWFFPYEILAWLRIRELMGLPNPETYEHPLMQQPLGQMPPDTPFPEDELLTQVVAKLKADHGIV